MKKISKNLMLTVILFVTILIGTISIDLFNSVKSNVYELIYNTQGLPFFDRINNFFDGVEISSNDVSYHDRCLDINSFLLNKTNRKVVEKSNETVVKMDNDYLAFASTGVNINERLINSAASSVIELDSYLQSKNIEFLYVYAPNKGYWGGVPEIGKINEKEESNQFLNLLDSNHVKNINIAEEMNKKSISEEDAFFITDHHWKPETGFWVNSIICKKLEEDYNFSINQQYLDISNYDITDYENCFLGSQGKKTGQYFSNLGLDGISIIEPKFDTSFSVSTNKYKNKTGNFGDTLLDKTFLGNKNNIYNSHPYSTYTGGDFAWEHIVNNKNNNGKKLLMLEDSFNLCVKPFMSLQFSQVDSIDLRYSMNADRISSVKEYIDDFKPDFVIVVYCGIGGVSDGKYNFD